jgi:hypothetical protein
MRRKKITSEKFREMLKETVYTTCIAAINARINGEFDNPALLKFGCLHANTLSDIARIIDKTNRELELFNPFKTAQS